MGTYSHLYLCRVYYKEDEEEVDLGQILKHADNTYEYVCCTELMNAHVYAILCMYVAVLLQDDSFNNTCS